jgi:hypothetical protein
MSAVIIKGGNARCSIAPWLSVRKSSQAVAFYQAAFDAKEVFRLESETGSVIARLSIGAEFWVGDESPEHANFSPQTLGGGTVRLILSVADPRCDICESGGDGSNRGAPSGRATWLANRTARRSVRTSLGNCARTERLRVGNGRLGAEEVIHGRTRGRNEETEGRKGKSCSQS